MDDRTLLELAAKAAGIVIHDWNGDWPVIYIEHYGDPQEPPEYEAKYWHPLYDDGDAFRMAVKLGIEIVLNNDEFADEFAAVRRAIVRAAAEIGKEME